MQVDLPSGQVVRTRADPEREPNMNTHRWLVSLLVMLFWGVAVPAADRVSHRPVNPDLADVLAPDQRLAQRLAGLKLDDKALDDNLKALCAS